MFDRCALAEAVLARGGQGREGEPAEVEGFTGGGVGAGDLEGEGEGDGVLAGVEEVAGARGGEVLGDEEGLGVGGQAEADGCAQGFAEMAAEALGEGFAEEEASADEAPAAALVGCGAVDEADVGDGVAGCAEGEDVDAGEGYGALEAGVFFGTEPGWGWGGHGGSICVGGIGATDARRRGRGAAEKRSGTRREERKSNSPRRAPLLR